MTLDPANAGREQDRRFSPGCSGNPAGKKVGTRHKATQAALALLSGEVDGLTRKAVELTLAGDVTVLRLCLERLVPPCREAPISLDLPRLETRADASRVLSFLLAEAGRGEVTPGEAENMPSPCAASSRSSAPMWRTPKARASVDSSRGRLGASSSSTCAWHRRTRACL
jgi:hypothetical protein